MILFSVGDVLYIKRLEGELAERGVNISFPGVADGTAVDVFRENEGAYCRGTFKGEKATFSGSFFTDAEYTIRIISPEGKALTTVFAVKNGILERAARAMAAELALLWAALVAVDEKYEPVKNEIGKLVMGYTTE